jgi:hypothetical protein
MWIVVASICRQPTKNGRSPLVRIGLERADHLGALVWGELELLTPCYDNRGRYVGAWKHVPLTYAFDYPA